MKSLYSFLLLLFLVTSLTAQYQLDSIVEKDFFSEEIVVSYQFTYENGLLSNYSESNDLDIDIFYNSDGTFDKWESTLEDATVLYDFVYDGMNNLDSFNQYYMDDAGYQFDFLTDIEAEGMKILSWESFESYDGYTGAILNADILYTSEGKLDSIKFFDLYTGSPELSYYFYYKYDTNGFLTIAGNEAADQSYSDKDSLLYSADGSTEALYSLSYYGGPSLDDLYTYVSDGTIQFGEIVSPIDFFDFFEPFADGEYNSIHFPMRTNSVLSHGTDSGNSKYTTSWYYSLFTGILDQAIVATPIVVYPNPTADFIQFKTEKQIVNYTIYSMTGQVIRTDKMTTNKISVIDLPTGNYTIVGQDNSGANYFATLSKM